MRSLLALDIVQLRRIQGAIAAFKAKPVAEQIRKQCLLSALEREEADLRKYCRRGARNAVLQSQAA